jgi:hypothetical protein
MSRFQPVIDARVAVIVKSLVPPIGTEDASAEDIERVIDGLQIRFKEYRTKPRVPFGRAVLATLQRLSKKCDETSDAATRVPFVLPPVINSVEASSMNSTLYAPVPAAIAGKRRRLEKTSSDDDATKRRAGVDNARIDSVLGSIGNSAAADGGFLLMPCVRPWERYSDVGGVRR